jgi:hypothetical protein
MINLLNFLRYDRLSAINELEQLLGWQYYGGKHYESIYTRWYQGFYLPEKFGFDKRKAHFSALICSGQMTREAAVEELRNSPYEGLDLQADTDFVLHKLGLSRSDLTALVCAPKRRHSDYLNSRMLIEGMSSFREFIRTRAKRV